jgi:MFS family permease
VVAAMIVGSSVAGIDSTVVAVALSAIGRNPHAGFGALQWTVTGYTLTLASLMLPAGSLSDRWGRRVFLAGLGWFTAASVLCAAAPGIGWLIAARAVPGIGGALMTPASLAIIEATFGPISTCCSGCRSSRSPRPGRARTIFRWPPRSPCRLR